MAKAEVSAVQAGAKAVLKAVARLHPDEALDVLVPMSEAERQGIRKRVLLAARVALMRKAMAAPARVVVAPVVEVVPEVVAPPPPPAPKPLAKGRIMSINLDDLSSMLMAEPVAPEAPPGPAGAAEAGAEAGFAPLDWGEVAGTLEAESGVPPIGGDADAPAPMAEEKPKRGKKRGAVVAIKETAGGAALAVDPGALFAALEEAEVASAAPVAIADAGALFAAMAEKGVEGPKAKPAVIDAAAAFAALEEAEVASAAPVAIADAGALFAAMAEEGPSEGVAERAAPVAALDAAEDGDVRALAPAPGKPAALAVDLSAQFAAMDGD